MNNLRLRLRAGNDFTSRSIETKQYNEYPVSFNTNSSTGSYGQADGRYSSTYTDAFLTYMNTVSTNLIVTANAGVQTRSEKYNDHSSSTNGGLALENWFNLKNSYNPVKIVTDNQIDILKYGFLGLLNLNYKDYLFTEITGRKEYSSTLPPRNNSFFYPSVSTSFILSKAFHLPEIFQYTRLRAAYGVVGNAPPAYESNVIYDFATLQTQRGAVVSTSAQGLLYGNNQLKSENKYEFEAGVESRLLKGRLGFDITYYSNRIKNQILKLDLPTSTGAGKIISNLGQLKNQGIELSVVATPLTGNLAWETGANIAVNTTKVHDLVPGVDWLVFNDLESGAIKIVAEKDEPVGNIYVYPRKTDASGNVIINSEGLYVIDKTRYVKAGNVLPRVIGGFTNSISINAFKLHFTVDYSIGGSIVSPALKYGLGSGLYENTLKFRDEARGGLAYFINDDGNKILVTADQPAPQGKTVYNDGVLLKGVTEEGLANTKVIDAATYYLNTFDWGSTAWNEKGAVYKNSYVKMREVVLSYSFPKNLSARLRLQYLRVSLTGRNLFYVWRTLKNLDPESTIGSNWMNQSVDEGSSAATRSYGINISMGF
jgi:iron complex outermembrane receptor protein